MFQFTCFDMTRVSYLQKKIPNTNIFSNLDLKRTKLPHMFFLFTNPVYICSLWMFKEYTMSTWFVYMFNSDILCLYDLCDHDLFQTSVSIKLKRTVCYTTCTTEKNHTCIKKSLLVLHRHNHCLTLTV